MKFFLLIALMINGLLGCAVLQENPKINNTEYHPQQIESWINIDAILVKDAPNGNVIGTIIGGNRVSIYKHSNNWALISSESQPPRWVSSLLLCEYEGCYVKPVSSEQIRPIRASYTQQSNQSSSSASQNKMSTTPKKSQNKTMKAKSVKNYSETNNFSCACSAYDYCVGPRGGHYCISSGGNKRYLPR